MGAFTKRGLRWFLFYVLRSLRYELQIIVYAQADHVTFTILHTNLNSLQRFYGASLGTSSVHWSCNMPCTHAPFIYRNMKKSELSSVLIQFHEEDSLPLLLISSNQGMSRGIPHYNTSQYRNAKRLYLFKNKKHKIIFGVPSLTIEWLKWRNHYLHYNISPRSMRGWTLF